jgi:hypothetical protein
MTPADAHAWFCALPHEEQLRVVRADCAVLVAEGELVQLGPDLFAHAARFAERMMRRYHRRWRRARHLASVRRVSFQGRSSADNAERFLAMMARDGRRPRP